MNISDYQLCEHGGKLGDQQNRGRGQTGYGGGNACRADRAAAARHGEPYDSAFAYSRVPHPFMVEKAWQSSSQVRRVFFCHQKVFQKALREVLCTADRRSVKPKLAEIKKPSLSVKRIPGNLRWQPVYVRRKKLAAYPLTS